MTEVVLVGEVWMTCCGYIFLPGTRLKILGLARKRPHTIAVEVLATPNNQVVGTRHLVRKSMLEKALAGKLNV